AGGGVSKIEKFPIRAPQGAVLLTTRGWRYLYEYHHRTQPALPQVESGAVPVVFDSSSQRKISSLETKKHQTYRIVSHPSHDIVCISFCMLVLVRFCWSRPRVSVEAASLL
ncbi:unnamed protein product, partial [Pylaiella littoralis]